MSVSNVQIPATEQLKINLKPNKWQHFQDSQFVSDKEMDFIRLDKLFQCTPHNITWDFEGEMNILFNHNVCH